MKLAIALKGDHLTEQLDARFGRSKYFCIYNTETKSADFLKNKFASETDGVGKQVVDLLLERDVKMIVACEIGRKVRTILEKNKIQMVIMQDASLNGEEVLKKIRIDKA